MNAVLLDALVFTSLGLVGMGAFFRHKDRYVLKALGFLLFGLFWALRIPEIGSTGDVVNTFFVAMALPFFSFLAYQEVLVYRGGPENRGLEMLAGGVFFGGMIYFIMAKSPMLSGGVISMVANQSASLARLSGAEYTVGALQGGGIWYSSGFSSAEKILAPILRPEARMGSIVNIVFACTGVQSIMIFVGPILFTTSASPKKKLRVIAVIVPAIYFLNLVRNAGIVILIDQMGYSPPFAHDIVGKFGSLAALLVLAFVTFRILPELLDDMDALFELFTHPTHRRPRSPPAGPSPPLPPSQQG